jgi:hypothetical protein
MDVAVALAMKTDGKIIFLLPFLYFLAETRSGSETESGYVGARKRTNMAGNSMETVGSREL